jgi:cysteine synthase B
MKAFGAELILTPASGGMEYARDLAEQMQREGKGRVLDQFANPTTRIHYETTGPEIWEHTGGRITHFVSAMGTTGTITGVSRYLKERTRRCASSARSRPKARASRASASGPRPTCPRSTTRSARGRTGAGEPGRRRGHGAPPGARGGHLWRHLGGGRCWVALQLAQQLRKTPPSCSSSATAATATCPPACFRPDLSIETSLPSAVTGASSYQNKSI